MYPVSWYSSGIVGATVEVVVVVLVLVVVVTLAVVVVWVAVVVVAVVEHATGSARRETNYRVRQW